MKKLFILIAAALMSGILFAAPSGKPVQVDGYTKKNGTYVEPHTRSAPGGKPKAEQPAPKAETKSNTAPIVKKN